MSLVPGMITDGRVPGARSVPEGRRPCELICAPLGLDIARGVAERRQGCPHRGGAYRLNSDQDRDSKCGRFTLVYGCWRTPQKRHFPPLSAMCSTIASGGFTLCKFNGRHRMGTTRGVLRRWRRRMARAIKNCHDRSMVLYSMFLALLETHGVALGFVVLAFQAEELACGISIQMGERGNRQGKA